MGEVEIEELAYELIELIRDGSPVVWVILMRQVYIEIVSLTIWAAISVAANIALLKFGNYSRKRAEEEFASDWEMGMVLAYIFSITSVVVVLGLATTIIKMVANPEFYAIQFMLHGLGQ